MMYATLFLAILLAHEGLSSKPCCEGENRLIKKKCPDGSSVTALTCPTKYITSKNDTLMVDENDNLVIASSLIPNDKYCATQRNDADVYIVCFRDVDYEHNKIFLIDAILELISVFFLIITIAIYLQVPALLDLQGICIINSIAGLAVSFVVLATNQLTTSAVGHKLCMVYAYITYISMLYAFFWLNALAFHIWRTIVRPKFLKNHQFWPHIYWGFGVGGPTALLILLIIASSMEYSDVHPGFGETKCWFKSVKSQFIYFYGPMALLLCLNIVYYGSTITILWKNLTNCDEKKAKVLKYRLSLCVKLFFIMGISWIFELVSAAFQDVNPILQYFWYATDCINTLQGIFIFLILVVFRKRVIRGMANRRICWIRLPSRWRTAADEECEEIEEELGLSETEVQKP